MKNKVPIKKYDITQCALYKCRTRKRLEYLLRLDPGGLKIIDGIIGYHKFEIDKKHSDEKREITAPDKTLKAIQRRILYLLQRVIRPEWLISGEKQKCYIDNGKAHLNGKYVLTIDIKKFYDNCTREPVYQFFVQKLETSPDVAEILTNIITYNGGIPTGCPTSQIMAFYAYSDAFTASVSSYTVVPGTLFLTGRPCVQNGLRGGNENLYLFVGQLIHQGVKLAVCGGLSTLCIPKKDLVHGNMITGHELQKDLDARMLSLVLNICKIAWGEIHLVSDFVAGLLVPLPR